ncbi:MAG: hypothetical protein ACI9W2_005386, partial [Gammaproteobacteria bacterium]
MTLKILLGIVLVHLSAFAMPAAADCEGTQLGTLDYKLPNTWRARGNHPESNFAPACSAHDRCYQQLNIGLRFCNDQLRVNLANICNEFRVDSKPYGACHSQATVVHEHVAKRGESVYLTYQREALKNKRLLERKTKRSDGRAEERAKRREALRARAKARARRATEDRRKRAKARRIKRRKDFYRESQRSTAADAA